MALNKFWRRKEITPLEQQVAQAFQEIETSSSEMKQALKFVYLSSVKDFTSQTNSKKPVYLVLIPFPCLKPFNKISKKLISELERRIRATILFAAKRQIESKWIKKHRSQQRPRSRALTSVYDNLLEDLCNPGSIIGKRIRQRVDGSKFTRVFLDEHDKDLETRLEAIYGVYKALTTREVQFEFQTDHVFYDLKTKKKNQ